MIPLVLLVIALLTLYVHGTKSFNYWHKRGIKHDKPWPFFGNYIENSFGKISTTQLTTAMYWKYPNEKVVGTYQCTKPELIIRDPKIIQKILSTDFNYFYHRGYTYDQDVRKCLANNLFFADGDIWKLLRQCMNPIFTSSKLKAMFPLICARAVRLQEMLAAETDTDDNPRTLNARDIMARYTIDFIGSVAFGLDTDSINNENAAFRKLGKDIFHITMIHFMIVTLKKFFPRTFRRLNVMYIFEKNFFNLVKVILKEKNYVPSERNDFIDFLLECSNKGAMKGNSLEKVNEDGTPQKVNIAWDDKLLAAQVFIFFTAGFETSSSATSFTLHMLAYNPEVQKKVQAEVDRVLAKHNNKLNYDAVKEMTYLEWAFKEGLRIFPSLGYLNRVCAKKYTISELDLTIDPGVVIVIPVQALHMDPQYFDSPEEFRPERFDPEKYDQDTKKFVYLPFGEGPRACIGERLGLMQSLAGLAAIMAKFTVEPAPETIQHPAVDTKSNITQNIAGGLPLKFRKRS